MTRSQALANIRSLRDPDGLIKEAYAKLPQDDSVQFLVRAMEPVGAKYTATTIAEGDRVQNQVQKGLERENLTAEYEYQGSVIKNTHIRAYSDIDLLVLETRFYNIEPPQVATSLYQGDPIADLMQIRNICISSLKSSFPEAKVNDANPRAVKISGGSLSRAVDVVSANWWNTNEFEKYKVKSVRGVYILNAHDRVREQDRPFYHGALIDYKDGQTLGNTKKLIRLLKSLKYESDGKVTISSFDIEAIVYRMEDAQMQKPRGEEIPLANNCLLWLRNLEQNAALRESLSVPDNSRKIFSANKATLSQLTALSNELRQLLSEIEQGLARSYQKLAEAKLNW